MDAVVVKVTTKDPEAAELALCEQLSYPRVTRPPVRDVLPNA
jgi:hypothetical protein